MKEKFVEINFHKRTLAVIDQANAIIAQYQARGFTLTVRQLYYQFVARDLVENTFNNYQRIASIVDDARKAGRIDWKAIEDRTRFLRRIRTFGNPKSFLHKVIADYAEDVWRTQPYYVEVWIEKDALIGVIERVCNEHRVPYFACRGYPSSSELYVAAKRFRMKRDQGFWPMILYLGDHDPSGLQMVDNADNAISLFARSHDIEVRHLALTMSQIETYSPPPNYAKDGDSRTDWYIARTGSEECWELDALDPEVISNVIKDNLDELMDRDAFDKAIDEETANQNRLLSIKDAFDDLSLDIDGARRFAKFGTPAMRSELLRRSLKG